MGVSLKPRENPEDLLAVARLEQTSTLIAGRWYVRLPWKDPKCNMSNSYPKALARLKGVERKIKSNNEYGYSYIWEKFMMDDEKKEGSNASSSKIGAGSQNSRQDVDDDDQNARSNSYESESSAYSEGSGVDMASRDGVAAKGSRVIQQIRDKKETSVRRAGNVQKRRTPTALRQAPKRTAKKAPRKYRRHRNLAASGGISKSRKYVCQYCGHRCRSR
ncbi:unnamed protein product, partial [Iphiclides podalirius]